MAKHIDTPPGSWREKVRPGRKHHHVVSSAHITMGAIHMGGMLAGILAADQMKSPSARWSAIAAFGIATGIGEVIWRERMERQRDEREDPEPE